MTTAGSLLLTMRDNVPSADMPPVQVAIFGLQQSQQQCLSFFRDCIKYCEKHDMRREASGTRPTLEKLLMSQKVLVDNLDRAPDKARAAIHSLRNVNCLYLSYLYSLSCARVDVFFIKRPMSGPITWVSEARSS